ncbi:hypothetical protein N9Q35_00895 [Amylibacter sp.]|nr:hypothetical protein [Amylibacter sp.]
MKIIKIIWQILRKIKFLIVVSILALSLLINGTLFMGGKLLSVVTGGFETVTGMQTLTSKNKSKISKLDDNLLVERKIKRELKTELAKTSVRLVAGKKARNELKRKLTQTTLQLTTERKLKRELSTKVADISNDLITEKQSKRLLKKQIKNQASELALERVSKRAINQRFRDLTMGLVPFKGKKIALSAAVNETADTIGKRSLKSAKNNIASMPGEAIPWLGTSVIVGVTALELYDLCATIKDMNELKNAFNLSASTSDEELTVCSLEVPSKEDILLAVKNSPSAAWEKAKDITPTLEEIKATEMPDFSSWWDEKQKNTNDLSEKISKWWNEE